MQSKAIATVVKMMESLPEPAQEQIVTHQGIDFGVCLWASFGDKIAKDFKLRKKVHAENDEG